LNKAVRAPPICSMPVGEGAKRRTGLVFSAMIARDLEQGRGFGKPLGGADFVAGKPGS
jgi:hypothetical protein